MDLVLESLMLTRYRGSSQGTYVISVSYKPLTYLLTYTICTDDETEDVGPVCND